MMIKLLFMAVLLTFSTSTAFSQQKPDFSGTWKMNAAKSDFGAVPGPDSRTDVITHKEPSLIDEVTAESAQGKQQYTLKYTTDGKEVNNQIGTREVASTFKWESDKLLVTSKFMFNDTEVNAQGTWSLSPDGKTLTIAIHYDSSLGSTDQKIILEKQEPVPAKTP